MELAAAVLAGDVRALARALTLVEERLPGARELCVKLAAHTGRALRVGVTGAPGSGKSTLIDALIHVARTRGERVAVLAVDPSSPRSGGALLGDRVRMTSHAADDGVFVRSMASRGALGALAPNAGEALDLFDAAGFTLLFIESVGAGQADVDIAAESDLTLVLTAPGGGDSIQALKSGILEIADLWVVTKGDDPRAASVKNELLSMLTLCGAPGIAERICIVASLAQQGVDALLRKIVDAGAAARADGGFDLRRRLRVRRRILAAAAELCAERLPVDTPLLAELEVRIRVGDLSVVGAARALLSGGNA
ncbi:MAG: methylmalonyl Co-A mutase-associated GTPase MeaB [Planctomycetes bacterium]|nr:methylmalonyl Co-A mutase-associated GTPase MeaB [Planctomycetota bacterium]